MSGETFKLENIVVRAGAGAGKTTELTARVIGIAQDFFKQKQRFPRLVVTTFTRKATQELKERLLRKAIEVESMLSAENKEKDGNSLKKSNGIVDFVKKPQLLHISTIHGVLSLYLKLYGSRIGLSPELQFINDRQNRRNLKKIIRHLSSQDEVFAAHLETVLEYMGLNEFLNFSQKYTESRLTKNVKGPFSVEQMQEVIQRDIQSLLSTARDLSRRIEAAELSDSWKSLGQFAGSITARTRFIEIYDERPMVRKSKKTDEDLIAVKDAFMEGLKNLAAYNKTEEFLRLHQEFSTAFENCAYTLGEAHLKAKILSGEITMSDLEFLAGYLLKKNPETAELFSERWDYWLVDEYQDTSPLQVALIESLKGPKKEFVVGDPQQSIYLFRGARSEVFAAKELEVKSRGGSLLSKLTNYRSKPELLEFFNDTFQKVSDSGSKQFQPMIPKADNFDSQNIVAYFYIIPEPEKSENSKEVENPEFSATLHRCQTLLNEGAVAEQICILLRSNQSISKFVEVANRWGLPIQVHSSGQFSMRPEIIELTSFLQFLLNPFHNVNLVQFFRHPCLQFADGDLSQLIKDSQGQFWTSIRRSQNPQVQRLHQILECLNEVGLSECLFRLVEEFKFFEYCHQMDTSGMREANVWKFFSMLKSSERIPGFSYKNFIENLDSTSGEDSENSEQVAVPVVAPAKVSVMTVHASKGLQFEHIILPCAGTSARNDIGAKYLIEDKIRIDEEIQWTLALPDPDSGSFKKSLFGERILAEKNLRGKLEEERVLYVALTRAISTVTMISCGKVESGSWLELLGADKSAGIYNTERYSYSVFTEVPPISEFPKKAIGTLRLIPMETSSLAQKTSRLSQKVSVTALLERDLLREATTKQYQKTAMADVSKAVLGVEIHRAFENLKYHYLENPALTDHELVEKLPHKFAIFADFLTENAEGPWLEIIKHGNVEYGFTVLLQEEVIQGQIDLWGIDSQGQGWVIDYKTGSAEHVGKAFEQLQLYSEALIKMGKLKPQQTIHLAVLYPFEKKVFKKEVLRV